MPFLVRFVSGVMTLLPGDIITTGTPAGIGPMHPGDRVDVQIEGIGVLSNTLVRAKQRKGGRMKFFLDTANLEEIREVASWGILDGVTTNPTLVSKESRTFEDLIREICAIVPGPVSAEAVSSKADEIHPRGQARWPGSPPTSPSRFRSGSRV